MKFRTNPLLHIGQVIILAAAVGLPAASSLAATTCDRTCLEKTLADYVAAMVKRDASDLNVTKDLKISENGAAVKLGEGPNWQGITSFKSQPQYVTDVQAQEIGYVGVVEDQGKPAFLAIRLKVRDNAIAEVESVLTHDGEGGPAFLPEGMIYREAPYLRDVPAAVRSSRADLKKVSDEYWDIATSTHDGSEVPYSVDCWHFENGMNTNWERVMYADEANSQDRPEYQPQGFDGRIWTCAREVYLTTSGWKSARDRHYIYDEDRGLVFQIVYVDPQERGGQGGPGGPGGQGQGGPGAAPGGAGGPGGAPGGQGGPGPQAAGGPGGAPGGAGGPGAGGGPGGPRAALTPIEGPGNAPLGISQAGFSSMGGGQNTTAHFQVVRIVDGKITREQDVMHNLPMGSKRIF